MSKLFRHITPIPPEQESIRAKCIHPAGTFIKFEKEEVEQSVASRFEKIVAKYPHRIAVKTKNHELTYDALNQAANRVARAILTLAAERDEPLAILLDHDSPLLVAVIGALKASKVCVPLDPMHPENRMREILDDSGASIILTNDRNISLASKLTQNGVRLLNLDQIDFRHSGQNLGLAISPDAFAFIVYTSGSTGRPKGVTQSHRNMLHNALRYTNNLHICADDRVTLLASLGTGQGVPTAFCTLLNGATLCLFNIREEGTAHLANWLIDEGVTVFISASTVFRQLIETLTGDEQFPQLRLVRLGAEQVRKSDVELYKGHFSSECIFGVTLSSTESGNFCHFFFDKETEITGDQIPVGYASEDMEIVLLDNEGREIGFDQVGEITIKSRYLSPGYWRNPNLTDAVFRVDAQGGSERIYRTGDLGVMRPDGCLEHRGRKDLKVKIRGFGVEVEEIENALRNYPGVQEAVVEGKKDESGENRLVAYVVTHAGNRPSVAELYKFISERLPEHMVPSAFVFLEALPLTPVGKVDRRALPAPTWTKPASEVPFVEPHTEIERALAKIWQEVLHVDKVGLHDKFFDLGGNSLRLAQINHKVCELSGRDVPVMEMLNHPTINALARYLKKQIQKDDLAQSRERAAIRRALRDWRKNSRHKQKQGNE
jgi:amino acid adenylation domain-containing protein